MYSLLLKVLFLLPPETSHDIALIIIKWAQRLNLSSWFIAPVESAPVTVMGLEFPNPVGLAAGLDKNADYLDGLASFGFGFIEVGTVTPLPQPGNPMPRMFRLATVSGIINRMGFNNRGVDHLVEQVIASRYKGILGINIGKNKDTSADQAVDDYLICMRKVYPYASYITVNLSSPNTPGLRDLQFGEPLENLLARLKTEQALLSQQHDRYVPLAVKIAPDMAVDDIQQVANALLNNNYDAVIATNTTIARDKVTHLLNGNETGGLSGGPLTKASTEVVAELSKVLAGRMPIIGVGGIMDGEDAADKIRAGASLVQIYTGFIYRGPALVRQAVAALRSL